MGLFALIGFALLLANNILFMHTHILPDGQVVMHAHPYHKTPPKDSGAQQHSHNAFEFFVFAQLQLLFFLPLLAVLIITVQKRTKYYLNIFFNRCSSVLDLPLLRGPPAFLL